MKRSGFLSLEWIVVLYFLSYLPNILLTKLATSRVHPRLGRPLTGLETLPSTLIVNMLLTLLFIWLSGWHRDAHAMQLGGMRLPVPTRYTALSGIGTALVLFTVPLSFTFTDVSIPFIQLLMRGDILLIAPLVDLIFRRRVRWWSWTALVDRGRGADLRGAPARRLSPAAAGDRHRGAVHDRLLPAPRSDDACRQEWRCRLACARYFVEEKIIALPMSIVVLALVSLAGLGNQAGELHWGFTAVWSDPVIWPLLGVAVTLTIVSVFAAIILLDKSENSLLRAAGAFLQPARGTGCRIPAALGLGTAVSPPLPN